LGISIRTYQRWKQGGTVKTDGRTCAQRPSPSNKLSPEEREQILCIANSTEYSSLPPSQIVPSLADKGIYVASESSFYRVLKQEGQQNHRGRSRKRTTRKPSTHKANGSNQVWTWDITYLPGPVKGIFFYLYMILDIFSRKIVAYEVYEQETSEKASELIRRAILSERICANPLILHSDNGSPMKAATFKATLESLGIMPSYSRPRVSNDNPYSESLFKTCKYRPEYPCKGFATLEEAREWALSFSNWYNYSHHHSGIGFVTPHERHSGKAEEIMVNRRKIYEEAKARNPQRWSGNTRNWTLPETVWLNPEKEIQVTADTRLDSVQEKRQVA
jgi:putative transposase